MISTRSGRHGSYGRYISNYGMTYFYREYKKEYPSSTVTQKQFTDIWKEYTNRIMNLIIKEKYDFKMQAQIGRIYIVSKKIEFKFSESGDMLGKGLRVDWNSTVKAWNEDPNMYKERRVIYFFNEHSSRRNFKFYWDKRRCKIKNQSYYLFYPTRKWKRELAKWIKSDDFDTIYYEAK